MFPCNYAIILKYLCFHDSIHHAVIDCGILSPPPNGSVITPFGTTAGDVALYSCVNGLVLTGSTARVCRNDGEWIPGTPTCEGEDQFILAFVFHY